MNLGLAVEQTKKLPSINEIAATYLPVIEKFKARFDVQNGAALGYHYGHDLSIPIEIEDKPKGIGDGTTTTGFCVSASQALLSDKVFKFLLSERKAFAKLVSIDIQRRFHGICYTGSQNKWHTAIYVKDNGVNFIVDLTCAQFGNPYVGKLIWDFNTWLSTFRSPTDQHTITDFDGDLISPVPLPDDFTRSIDIEKLKAAAFDRLHNITNMTDLQRTVLAEFLVRNMTKINAKILIGNVTKRDYEYIENINTILRLLDFTKYGMTLYSLFQFKTPQAAKNWVKLFFDNKCICPGFVTFANSIENASTIIGCTADAVNTELSGQSVNRFIMLKLVPDNNKPIHGIDVSEILDNTQLLIPYGIKLGQLYQIRLFNSGLLLEPDMVGNHRKTNTTVIEIKM